MSWSLPAALTAQILYPERPVVSICSDTNYASIAKALGAWSERVTKPGDVADAVRAALSQSRVSVIDCVIGPDESMRQSIYSPLALEAAGGRKP